MRVSGLFTKACRSDSSDSGWNEKLDVVEMHRVIIDAFRKGFSQAEMLASPKKQAELILVRFGAAVGERKSFVQVSTDLQPTLRPY